MDTDFSWTIVVIVEMISNMDKLLGLYFQYFADFMIYLRVFFYLVEIRKWGKAMGKIVGKVGVFEFNVDEFTFCVWSDDQSIVFSEVFNGFESILIWFDVGGVLDKELCPWCGEVISFEPVAKIIPFRCVITYGIVGGGEEFLSVFVGGVFFFGVSTK